MSEDTFIKLVQYINTLYFIYISIEYKLYKVLIGINLGIITL